MACEWRGQQECSAGDVEGVPTSPRCWHQDLGQLLSPTVVSLFSFCRCGKPGSQIHPAGSLQPVHQVQAPGVTARSRSDLSGDRASGGAPASPRSPWLVPPPPHFFFSGRFSSPPFLVIPQWAASLEMQVPSTSALRVCSLASPGVPQGPSQLLIKRWKRKKKTGTPTLSPWEAGAGCLAFQLTVVSDHKSSETRCSLAAGRWLGSPGGISWAGLSWAARPFYKKKAFFSLKKEFPPTSWKPQL